MRKLLKAALVVAMAVPGLASAATIKNSAHDLSATGASGIFYQQTDEKEICKFCHTPHNAKPDSTALWNREDPTSTFSWAGQGGVTNYGTALPVGALGAPTMRCMSCHDGVTALGATRAGEIGNAKNADGTPSAVIRGVGLLTRGTDVDGNLDLSGNHPVSVTYPNDNNGLYLNMPFDDRFQDATVLAEEFEDYRNVTLAKIYQQDEGTPGIECGSCHDPHGVSEGGVPVDNFLRVGNEESKLCLACHAK
jgi:predicted CXXCH cytochrome family protein